MTSVSRSIPRLHAALQCCRAPPLTARLPLYWNKPVPSAASWHARTRQCRPFSASALRRESEGESKAHRLSQKEVDEEEEAVVKSALKKQREKPWHREGHEGEPPSASADPTKGDPTKGRLLTTPTRLLKLVLPLPGPTNRTKDDGKDSVSTNDVQPLALLVHPQQPLSYLERLLQAELPPVKIDGNERIPSIVFRAEAERSEEEQDRADEEENVESYSGLGHEGPGKTESEAHWVRWSTSTELGDFIRDAARGREFEIDIEGYDNSLRVAVPSFNDRTYYMRIRLRKMSRRIDHLAKLKQECDMLAHRGAYRMAKGGFGLLAGWWGIVYYVTFHTELGWDLVEPVTYLAGLTTIMGGYLWFLYISRDLNYRAIMNVTVSRRQTALYQAKGFDINKWEQLVHEANALRNEIRMVATEYDVDWDETRDLGGEEVKEVLEEEKQEEKDMRERQMRQKEKADQREKKKKEAKSKE